MDLMVLRVSFNNKRRVFNVHRLVAKAFIPNPKKKTQVNHKDGNPSNNHVDNLEWCTPSENVRHSFKELNRKPAKGNRLPQSKLNYGIAQAIRRSYVNGKSQNYLAKHYNVSRNCIYQIIHYKA